MSSNDLPPPSSNVISLAYVEIVLSAIFLPLVGFIAWKHGKAGMACWQIYMTAFVAKLVANIYLIVNKEKPYSPTVVSNITDSGVIATISLGIIGIVYEAYVTAHALPLEEGLHILDEASSSRSNTEETKR